MGASSVTTLFSSFALFKYSDTTERHFRKFCYCLYCCKYSVLLWPIVELNSLKFGFEYSGKIAFLS